MMPRHFTAPIAIAVLAALGACACASAGWAGLGPPRQRTSRLVVQSNYTFAQHGETGFGLHVVNGTDRPLRLVFYVTLPDSHPPQRVSGTGGPVPPEWSARCSGVQQDTMLAGGAEAGFGSCLFTVLARGPVYEGTLVVHDGDAGAVESLRFVFDLARAQRRLH